MALTIFFVLILIAIYPYAIYPILCLILVGIKRLFEKPSPPDKAADYHTITLLIAAYNEENFIEEKIANTKELDYPNDKLEVIFVSDGSNDRTPQIISQHHEFKLLHQPERNGKIDAISRGIKHSQSEILVFCDANTYINRKALKNISKAFQNPKVGSVSGEKRVISGTKENAASSGEGFYWRYESFVKQTESQIYTVVGAVGELFAIRRNLYEPVAKDTILDDFLLTLSIVKKGYRIKYEPQAIASEYGSINVKEEMKRKIRIAAGSFQALSRNRWLLNIIKHPILAFQFISHKLMRWITTPLILPILIPYNIILSIKYPDNILIHTLLILQAIFYTACIIGHLLQHKQVKSKFIFFPYYFTVTNITQYLGLWRLIKGSTSVKWEKAERKTKNNTINQ